MNINVLAIGVIAIMTLCLLWVGLTPNQIGGEPNPWEYGQWPQDPYTSSPPFVGPDGYGIDRWNSGNVDNTSGELLCNKDLPQDHDTYRAALYVSEKGPRQYLGKTPRPSQDHQERPAPYPQDQPAMDQPIPKLSRYMKDPACPEGSLCNYLSALPETYYLDPADMTKAQRERFKWRAKFPKMTVQDYTNWLMLFRQRPEQLSAFHRGNLRIIMHGGRLTTNDLPQNSPAPPTAEQQYYYTLVKGDLENIPQPEWLGYKPANFAEQYAPAGKERDLRQLDFINPDEPLKTWILDRTGSDDQPVCDPCPVPMAIPRPPRPIGQAEGIAVPGGKDY